MMKHLGRVAALAGLIASLWLVWQDNPGAVLGALRAAPTEQFRVLLARLGESTPDVSIFQAALEFSEFENMRKLEAAGAFDSKILQARDPADPESFKVRRGKVGGYTDYLATEDRQYATGALAKLDRRFGYDGPERQL